MHLREKQAPTAQSTVNKAPFYIRLRRQGLLLILSVFIACSSAEGAGLMDVNGTTQTDTLTVLGLDCTLNANGGTLTTNASGEVICADNGNALVDDSACVADGVAGTVVSGFNADGTFHVSCFGGVVTTLAGSNQGSLDGTGTTAHFFSPSGLTLDRDGSLFVADTNNDRIRKVTPLGVVTTLAGSGAGFADGTGAAAKFWHPGGVAIDKTGNIFVADTDNHRIRKVTPEGVVTTLAGSSLGFADDTGAAAKFAYPSGLAVDGSGNLIVADSNNHRIRKVITQTGVVTTLVGSVQGFTDGNVPVALFNYPQDVAIDGAGNLFVADSANKRIRKVTPAGVVTTLAGSTQGFADGTGAAAKFKFPYGVAVDGGGNVFVADKSNHRIRKVTPAGVVTTLAGSSQGFADGTGTAAKFNFPSGVAIDAAGTVIYVADTLNHRIRQIR